MLEGEKKRLTERLKTCRRELKNAKWALKFWSDELRVAVEKLASDKEFQFESVMEEYTYVS